MSIVSENFLCRGYIALPNMIDERDLAGIDEHLSSQSDIAAGDRRLLDQPWCRKLAAKVRSSLLSRQLIDGQYVATLCTFLDKSADSNWGVASHRDLSISVRARFDLDGWRNWTDKQGLPHVQPPESFLQKMFAIRVHVDCSDESNGTLIVTPCSHQYSGAGAPSVAVGGPAGSALMMSPLLLHASRKATAGSRRRVLHFLFGPACPEPPVEWFYAA